MENVVERIEEKFADKILKSFEKSNRRIYLDFKPDDLTEAAEFVFKDLGCRFVIASGTDTPGGIEILYHFSHDLSGKMISLRILIADRKNPQMSSIAHIIKGAEWIEREIWELLGVNFIGHPDLRHLLLIDDWPEGKYPLRKDR
jgi:Ni,Fe-hydrogenase III component G